MEQWRDVTGPQLLRHLRADHVPSLHRICFSIIRIQRTVPHLDALRIDLHTRIDVLEGVVPPISEVLAVCLRLPRSGEAKLFVRACLRAVSTDLMPGAALQTASGTLSFPAIFKHNANTAALSVA